MKKIYLLLFVLISAFFTRLNAQISLTADAGTLTGSYTTLKAAFDAINIGTHKGNIIIELTASTVEGTTPATLLSGDADPTSYTFITIYPTVDGVSISGNPASGFGVVQLNGADNILIDGDNPNTPGFNRNLSIVNTAATGITYTSCLRVATLAGASASADNIFLLNCNFTGNVTSGNAAGITATTSSSNTSFGIYCGGKGSATTPTAITSETADAALAGTTINNVVIDNIAVNQCGRGIVFNGAASTVSSSLSITNSIIGAAAAVSGYPITTPVTTVYSKGIWVAGADVVFIGSNTIQNILSYVNTTIAGIELASNIGVGNSIIDANIITGVINNGTGGTANGIIVSSATNKFTVSKNVISLVQGSLATSALPVAGINIATSGGIAAVIKNKVFSVFNKNAGGYGAIGIYFSTAANAGEISNNFIYDVMNTGNASFTNASENASGILIGSGSSHKIYHNSVHLSGVSPATGSNVVTCFSVASSAIALLDIRNNIFSNKVTGGSASDAHVCMYFPFTSVSASGYLINNNAYYTGTDIAKSGIAFAGASSYNAANLYDVASFIPNATTPATNFRNWSSAAGLTNNDFASFGSAGVVPFVSATDLHIVAGASRLESGGVTTSITDDIDAAVRGTFPDIGADEFAGTIQDLTAPLIAYTPLVGTCSLGNRTLTVNIKDPSGVPVAGAGLPVLYWSVNASAGPFTPVTGVSAGGGNYNFTFGGTAMVPDIVYYYVVAQDAVGTPNVISTPSAGAGGFTANAPAASTPPPTPESYSVQTNLAPGTYLVGAAQPVPFNTLTAAVNRYNTSCLGGAVIFELTDASYSASETFPIIIGNPVASVVNTLTIRPASTINPVISGPSADAIIKFNGADYVTIDGSNNGTSTQNLTITNTNASTASAVIWVASASATNGATNNVIKNCTVTGNGTLTTYAGIVSGGGNTIGSVAAIANSNNTYQNISVHTAFRGIALVGASAGDNNNTISDCKIGTSVVLEKIGFRGIFVFNQTNINISRNIITGITSTVGSNSDVSAGISVRGAISNGVIHSNNISDCKNTSTSGWTVHGITLQSTTANTGMTVYNNFIYDIAGFGWAPNLTDNGHGIGILSGGGYKVYYNSINLTTNQSVGNTAAIFIDNRTAAGSTPVNLDIRNNIFSNQQTTNTRYSIYSLAPASSFTTINYNDYYTTGSTLGFLGSARANLAAWQAATGGDGFSVSVNPQFTSATNLHLLGNSSLDALATPIGGFTTDIDAAVRNATTPDIGADEFTPPACAGVMTAGTITASKTTLCVSENVVFSSAGFSFGTGMSYQWESSPDNATWSPVAGETSPLAASITISTTTYYRLFVSCSNNAATAFSTSILVTVNSPSVTSSAGASVCGLGTVNLTAVGSGGTTLRWYDVLTGGAPLATGSPYATPSINTTTTYYVEAVAGISTGSVGPTSPTTHGGTIQTAWPVSWELYFDVIQTTTLISVDVFPFTAGQSSTLNVYNSANVILATVTYTTTVSGGATAQTVTFPTPPTLPVGSGYYVYAPGGLPGGGLTRNSSGSAYPYTSAAINITTNDLGPGYYMYYYNWQFSSGCASAPRTAVVATVSTPPVFSTPVASPPAMCEGATSNLTSLDADYSTYSWTPTLGLSNPAIANPAANPTATTTYTVTVSNGTCATSADVTVTVNPTPTALSITPAGPVAFCVGAAAQSLTATGGSGNFFRERFEAFPISKFNVTGTGITENQSTTYFQEGASSVRLTHTNSIPNASPAAYESATSINLSLYSSPVLTFQQICALENTGTADWDFGYVEYSTDNGTSWTPFPTSSYTGSGTLRNGVVCFEKTSYGDWNTQFPTDVATPGAGPATSLWKLETINLSAWQSSTQFKFRFRIKSDGSVTYYGWMLDDIKINGQATITWGPTTDLFTNAGATINYTGTNNPVVYTKPTANRTYIATAAFGSCPQTASVQINLTSNGVSLAIASAQGTSSICGADTVDLSSVPTPAGIYGGTAFYDWKKNGTTITGSATGGSSVGTTITVASTVTLFPGMRVSVSAGAGFFQANTIIQNILNATQFTVNLVPTIALSGATVSATATGSTVTSLRYSDLANGDVITCVLSVGGVLCMPANPVTSNTLTFTILPTTATSVSVAASATTICSTQSVTFTATPTNGGAAPTYEWFINGASQGAASASTTFTTSSLANGNIVTCRMYSNASNCPFPKAPFSNNITMTVNPSFAVSVTITSSPAPSGATVSICNGTSVTFTATPTNGGVTPLYEWFVNGSSQGAPSGSNTFTSSTLADLDVITCVLTSSISSCALGNPATSNALNISVTTQVASVSIAPVTAICAGIARTYTATPINGGATPQYEWFINGGSVQGPNGTATYTFTPTTGDLVEVRMASSLTCASPNPAIFSFNQTVNAAPSAGITGSSTTYCPGIPVALNSNAVAGSGSISSIQWRLNYANIGGATSLTYTATNFGLYKVTITNSNGCTDTSSVINITDGSGPLNGTYYIGRINAANVNGSTTTLTATSTANLVVGAVLTRISGGGTLAANTVVTSIVNGTTFTVNNAPTVALAGAVIGGADCDDYLSFATAISDLNTRTMGGVGCTFNVQPGYVENLTAKLPALGTGGLLNATAAIRTLTFQKNGAGTNPKIVAYTGGAGTPGTAAPDGIFTISGTDNVTIDGIDLDENAANTTNPSTMEYGYGLFKLAAGDGVQNTTIKNCVITLNRINNASATAPMVEGSVGILVINSTAIAATTVLTPTNSAGTNTNGTNSTNKFYTNTIQNCNYGIALSGFAASGGAPAPTATTFLGDLGNDIGGFAAGTGNTILNFGSAGTNASAGIRATNQWSVNIQYNNLNSNNGTGTNHGGPLRGIFGESGLSANATISNNTVSIKTAATAGAWTGIENVIGSTAAANTVNINSNTVQNCSFSGASSPVFFGISNTSTASAVNINTNTVTNISISNTGGPGATLINNTATGTTTCSISNNNISLVTNAAVSGSTRGISVGNALNGTFNLNTIDGISYTAAASTGSIDGVISIGTGQTNTYNGNIVRNLSVPTTGTINGIRENGTSTFAKTIQNNQIYNFSTTPGGVGGATYNGILANVGTAVDVSGNLIYSLNSTGTTGGAAGVIAGIQTTSGSTITVSKNKIYNLSTTSTGPLVYGLLMTGTLTQTATVSNNFISDLKATAANVADAIRGIGVTSVTANTTYNVYYNSVYINATSSGAAFGTSGIYHVANGTATTASLNMRNNIIYNTSTKNGGALTVAFRRTAGTLLNYAASSNNNLLYAGTPSASNLIYYDGTNSDQTIAAYKTRVSTRDAASVSDVVSFTSATDLHLSTDNNCIVNGNGAPISGFTDDIDAVAVRNASTPDIGADEFTGTNPVSLTVTNPSTVCASSSVDLTVASITTGSAGGTQFYYYTDLGGTTPVVTPSNVTPAVTTTYYIKYGKGSCYSTIQPVVVTVTASGTWLGIDNNWNNTSNWCGGVPTSATNVIIPGSLSNYPIIVTGVAALANDVSIASGASVTTTGTGSLDMKGTFTNNGNLLNWGEIKLTGSTAQTFPGATGTVSAMTRLTIANTSGGNPAVTLNRDMLIREAITPTQGIINLGNAYVTLRSVVDSTARVAVVGGSASFTYTGTGNFVVERYFPGRRAWRLITAPVVKNNARTIFGSWQVGGNNSISGNGTFVSGPAANPATNGLDVSPANNSSLKWYNHATNALVNVLNTRTIGLPSFPGGGTASYLTDTTSMFMFVRGDRTGSNPDPFNPYLIGNSTVLRDTGNVKIGSLTYTCKPGAGSYTYVGNPYASPIDFTQIGRSGLANKFYIWDPALSSTGAYVLSDNGVITPNTGSGLTNSIIQSKQSFVVEATGAGATLTFGETAKSASNNSSLFRPTTPVGSLIANLYMMQADGSSHLADGVQAHFNDEYSLGADSQDGLKFTNVNETFSIKNAANYFILEKRPYLTDADTLFFSFNRARQLKYQLDFQLNNIIRGRNRVAYLEDKYLHTATPLNMRGTTSVNFEVNSNSASSAGDRFFITFKKVARFNNIKANTLYSDVTVNWSVENAAVIDKYEVERSSDGKTFEKVSEVEAGESKDVLNDYSLTDPGLEAGFYYYRVKAVSSSYAASDYTEVVKVKVVNAKSELYVYPNPVTEGIIHLKMNATSPEGRYSIRLINANGQAVAVQQIQHFKAASTELINYPAYLAGGAYQLEVTAPDRKKTMINLIVQKQ